MKKIVVSGKRKTAVARAVLTDGEGLVTINGKGHMTLHNFDNLKVEEPLRIAMSVLGKLNFNASITVRGGGEKGQVEAARLALAKGIVKFSGSEKISKALTDYDRNLLVADVRRKEAYKPGDSKARSKRQSSKR